MRRHLLKPSRKNMVLSIAFREIVRVGTKAFTRYYRFEGKAFNQLYRGFPQSKTIGRGVRHGLTGGSIVGSLINQNGEVEQEYGIPQKGFKSPSYRFKKTYSRFKYGSRSRNKYCYATRNRRRRYISAFRR